MKSNKPILLNKELLSKSNFRSIKEPINLENVHDNIKIVKVIYDKAQEMLIKENRVDNDKYIKCIELSDKIIKFLDGLNPFQINRIKEDIKTIYYISTEESYKAMGFTKKLW